MMNSNITEVTKEYLCVGCNICEQICPKKCITIMMSDYGVNIPVIDNNVCVNCGQCLKVCPGCKLYSGSEISRDLFKSKGYSAWAKDNNVRLNGTSGGVTMTLIESAIKAKLYDDAFIIDGYGIDKFYGTSRYSRLTDDTLSAKSRYVPISHRKTVSYILTHPNKRIIIVAVPCVISAFLEMIVLKRLNRDNYLFLGLFCEGTMSYNCFDYFKQLFAKGKEVSSFLFRSKKIGGWPGQVEIGCADGSTIYLNRKERTMVKRFFTLDRCLYCTDKLNHLADIALGDDYIKSEESFEGKNSVIVYTDAGHELWETAQKRLYIEPRDLGDIIKSQKYEKKRNNYTLTKLSNKLMLEEYSRNITVKPSSKAKIKFYIESMCHSLGKNKRYTVIYGITRALKIAYSLKEKIR